ncbi:hypothetical protein ABC383_15385 [Noviherbaspirillum sp. 1P10PC]|uniref:hypothetical protein n=1 Tax=Noviherbaspirillum sp. 1P10PC TaxID=3132292 RepID=UPI0039A0D78B
MSKHHGIGQKAVPQDVRMTELLLDDVVGAGNEPLIISFSDTLEARERVRYACEEFGSESEEAMKQKKLLADMVSRLPPIDR